MPRRIIYHPNFDEDATKLGGIIPVQRVIAPIVQALEEGDPTLFSLLDTTTGERYARTKAVQGMPPLVIVFEVDEDDDVIMKSVSGLGEISF